MKLKIFIIGDKLNNFLSFSVACHSLFVSIVAPICPVGLSHTCTFVRISNNNFRINKFC